MIVVRAPLRVTLGGGGTDFASYYTRYGGFALSMSISRYVHVVINRSPVDRCIRLRHEDSETAVSLDEIHHTLFREILRYAGIDNSVNIVTMSDAAPGTGLGSSGSFAVALLYALHRFRKESIDPYSLAEEAYRIESIEAGMPVGKQDQYMAAFGGLNYIDFQQSGAVTVSAVRIRAEVLEELLSHLLLFYSGIQRKSFNIALQQDRDTESGNRPVVDSLHNTKRIGFLIKEALELGNLKTFGELLHEHWENKKVRSREVSTSEIDRCYSLARENGAVGGKLVGSGGGGFLMLYCPADAKNRVRGAMAREGLLEMEYSMDSEGVKVLVDT